MRISILLGILAGFLRAAPPPSACEPDQATRSLLEPLELQHLNWETGIETRRAIVESLVTRNPENLFLNLRYVELHRTDEPERRAMIQRFQARAERHPDRADDQYLYAAALVDADTPQALERLGKILTADPAYPWAHVGLATIYSSGKFANRPELRRHLRLYYDSCPGSLANSPLALAARFAAPEDAAPLASRLRQRLVHESDPRLLRNWTTVWNLEFKAHPVTEHPQVRKQLAADLERLTQGPLARDVSGLFLLRTGYQLLGDPARLRTFEDRLIAAYPDSAEADDIVADRWSNEHPYPAPGDSSEKKQAFYRAQLQMAEQQLRKYPKDFGHLQERFYALTELQDSTAAEIIAAGEAFRAALRSDTAIVTVPPYETGIARRYLKRNLRPEEVPALVEEGWRSYRKIATGPRSDRSLTDTDAARARYDLLVKMAAAEVLVDAAKQLHRPDIAQAAYDQLSDASPAQAEDQRILRRVREKYAELHGLPAPAAESAQKLTAETSGRWEKPVAALPPWQLPDLQGQTWKLASFQGKTLLINLWATWCTPCRAEHPHLQKLYERIKDLPNIRIVTFNVDDEIGAVAPYLQENRYTFPVLLAKGYVDDLVPVVQGIPRNWIVDAKGVWQWQQIGFRSEENWEDLMLQKLEAALPSR